MESISLGPDDSIGFVFQIRFRNTHHAIPNTKRIGFVFSGETTHECELIKEE